MREIEGKPFCDTINKVKKVLKTGPWCLIGGRAVEFYTNPPQSPDSDCLLDATHYDIRKVIKDFKAIGVKLREEYEEGYIAFLYDKDTDTEVDLMPTYDRFEIQAIKKAKTARCGKASFPVIEIEDLVIMKAAAAVSEGGMMGRSDEKKYRDVKAIIVLQKENDLDGNYINKILRKEVMVREAKLLKKLGII